MNLRVSRSLTIKQMAMVASVSIFFIAVFTLVLLFHLVQQHRHDTVMQMENIARSVRQPLSEAILRADIPEAESILKHITPSGIISRADVVLPNRFQALRVVFQPEKNVPLWITRVFELPAQISLPLYSLERPANPQPLAYLVIQSDAWRMYRYIISVISTLVTTFLLLSLMLSVAVTWCINRLVVHPLRDIASSLASAAESEAIEHQLPVPTRHLDDEIGLLVKTYNRNQNRIVQLHEHMNRLSTRFPVSELPNKDLFLALLENEMSDPRPCFILAVSCQTLQDSDGVLHEAQREMLLLMLVDKLRSALGQHAFLAQINATDFVALVQGVDKPWVAMTLSNQVLNALNDTLNLGPLQLRPSASIGIAMQKEGEHDAQLFYQRALSASQSARRAGKNQVEFYEPGQHAIALQRLTEENDILNAMENRQFAIWLQPQVDMRTGAVLSAEVLLRVRQPDGSWDLPEGLIERIESCGLMVKVGRWVMEESLALLAQWQNRGISLPLSVNLSALQLLDSNMIPNMLSLLRHYKIQPGTLILEITESRRIDDPQEAVNILRPLHDAGLQIALDDFGMGYASLNHLHHIKAVPIDILKIDKGFVSSLPDDSNMVSVILSLAKTLGLKIVAEGVETEIQRQWLEDAGVAVGQGYLFGKAVTPEVFSRDYLAANDAR